MRLVREARGAKSSFLEQDGVTPSFILKVATINARRSARAGQDSPHRWGDSQRADHT